jgi:putative component of toxin-antitoxin plasmid stabilization module
MLPFPHQSSVRQGEDLRELRPRAGRSAWRAFYRRRAMVFVIAAVGPEAETDARGFARAIANAVRRLQEVGPS